MPVAGCGSAGDSQDAGASIDCAAAGAAMADYSSALSDLAVSIESGDALSAVGAADSMSFALDRLEGALPEIPAAGDTFLDASRAVTREVKQSAAQSPSMDGLLATLSDTFATPGFAEGGEAIDAYVTQACGSPTGEPTP